MKARNQISENAEKLIQLTQGDHIDFDSLHLTYNDIRDFLLCEDVNYENISDALVRAFMYGRPQQAVHISFDNDAITAGQIREIAEYVRNNFVGDGVKVSVVPHESIRNALYYLDKAFRENQDYYDLVHFIKKPYTGLRILHVTKRMRDAYEDDHGQLMVELTALIKGNKLPARTVICFDGDSVFTRKEAKDLCDAVLSTKTPAGCYINLPLYIGGDNIRDIGHLLRKTMIARERGHDEVAYALAMNSNEGVLLPLELRCKILHEVNPFAKPNVVDRAFELQHEQVTQRQQVRARNERASFYKKAAAVGVGLFVGGMMLYSWATRENDNDMGGNNFSF